MAQANKMRGESGMTIGFDLGDRYTFFVVLSVTGEVLKRGRVKTRPAKLEGFLREWHPCVVVLEVGTHSPWVSRLVTACGHEAVVANPRKVALVFASQHKSDARDCEQLARLARFDRKLLCPIRHRGAKTQADLAVMRARDALVKVRTVLVNHVRGAVKAVGARIPSGISTSAFGKKAKEHLPVELRPALEGVLDQIATTSAQIRVHTRRIEREIQDEYPEATHLMQIHGVGPLTSLSFVLTIEDPGRFERSRDVGPFLGLVPRRNSSGKRDPELRITKAGDRDVRRLLVQCAQHILHQTRVDSDLRRWGLKLAARGKKNAKKRAIVAMARKLAVLLHRLWVSGQDYEPLRHGQEEDVAA
jgi:transposase